MPKEKYKKVIITLMFSFFALFSFWGKVEANIIQTNHSAESNNIANTQNVQKLGTGLSGTITQLQLYVHDNSTPFTNTFEWSIFECPNDTYGGGSYPYALSGCTIVRVFSVSMGTGGGEVLLSTTTNFTLDATKYYLLRQETSGTADISMSGSAGNLYSGGSCEQSSDCGDITDWYFYMTGGTQSIDTDTRVVSTDPVDGELVNTLVGSPTATSSDTVSMDVDIYFNDVTEGGYIDQVCVDLQPIENPNITLVPICHDIISSAESTINYEFVDLLHGTYSAIIYFTNHVDLGTHFFSYITSFVNMYSEVPSQSCLYGSTLGVCNNISGLPSGYATSTLARDWGIPQHDCSAEDSITARLGCGVINAGISIVNFLFVPNGDQYMDMVYDLKDKVLTHFPIGYITDFVTIISTTTVGTLTPIDAVIPNGVPGTGAHIVLNLTGVLDPLLNATTGQFTNISASSTDTFYEITSHYWDIVCYILALFYIVGRILGSKIIPIGIKKI